MENITSGDRIYLLRSKMELSQAAFGKELGIFPQNISAWERNTRHPGMRACAKIIRLASKYGIDIDYNFLCPGL